MPGNDTIAGRLLPVGSPRWEPLEALVGRELASWFMWMCAFELDDGVCLQAYKHAATRRYLHLAADGRAFAHTGDGRYREIARRDAIDEAFADWELLSPEPEDPDAVRAALRHARRRA